MMLCARSEQAQHATGVIVVAASLKGRDLLVRDLGYK